MFILKNIILILLLVFDETKLVDLIHIFLFIYLNLNINKININTFKVVRISVGAIPIKKAKPYINIYLWL